MWQSSRDSHYNAKEVKTDSNTPQSIASATWSGNYGWACVWPWIWSQHAFSAGIKEFLHATWMITESLSLQECGSFRRWVWLHYESLSLAGNPLLGLVRLGGPASHKSGTYLLVMLLGNVRDLQNKTSEWLSSKSKIGRDQGIRWILRNTTKETTRLTSGAAFLFQSKKQTTTGETSGCVSYIPPSLC